MALAATLKLIGKNIARLRKEKGLSQAELARRIGSERQNMYRLESGKQNATVDLLLSVSKALGVPLKDLFDFDS